MFSGSKEPFVLCPLYRLLSCAFLIFLREDCSLGYQCWPLIVGIWAQDENIALFFFHSCRSSGNTTGEVSGRQQLQMIALKQARWLCPPRHCSRWSLYSCWPVPCQRSANRRWGLGLVSLPSCTAGSTEHPQLLGSFQPQAAAVPRAQAASCQQEGRSLQTQLMPGSWKQHLLILLAFYFKDIVASAL